MGVHWEDAFFAKSPRQDATTARPAPFGEAPEDGAPRLLHFRQMEPESTAETLHILPCKLTTDFARSIADASGVGAWFRKRAARACLSRAIPIKVC